MSQASYFTDPKKYFALLTNPATDVHGITVVNDKMVLVNHTTAEDFVTVCLTFLINLKTITNLH